MVSLVEQHSVILLMHLFAVQNLFVYVHYRLLIGHIMQQAVVRWMLLFQVKTPYYSYLDLCQNRWSVINGKCLFVSTFYLNWTDALTYCKSFTAQLWTLSLAKVYSSLTLSQISNLVLSHTSYFIGLSQQPSDSGEFVVHM
jgi:hypothetical protein